MKICTANKALLLSLSLCLSSSFGREEQNEDQTKLSREENNIFQSPGDPNIVGGVNAKPGRYPYYAGLFTSDGRFYCGGTLIDTNWVLTAAHCNAQKGDVVKIGLYKRLYEDFTCENENQDLDLRTVKQFYPNPGYNGDVTNGSDVGLILLSRPSSIRPIAYDDGCGKRRLKEGDAFRIIGLGRESTGGVLPYILKEAKVNHVLNKVCAGLYDASIYRVTKDMICAAADGKDTCHGDSGGPLLIAGKKKDGSRDLEIGVTSWGDPACANPNFPGVYAKLRHKKNADFIFTTITGKDKSQRCEEN